MFVPLPNLDDRRWADLVDEGRTLIPINAPTWTDHNAHDPGITLMELLAWITETDIYRVNSIPDAHRQAFLSLIGGGPLPPAPARAVVMFELLKASAAVHLPATTLLDSPAGQFQLRTEIMVLPVAVGAVQVESGGKFRDVTGDWQRGKPLALLGDNPQPGDSFYLGFTPTPQKDAALSLYFSLSGDKASPRERQRILDELASHDTSCGQPARGCEQTPAEPPPPTLPPHHSTVIVWEVQTAPGVWQTVEAADETRSLTLSGAVTLPLPHAAAVARTGVNTTPLAYVRARFAAGSFEAAPVAARVLANAAEVEQCAPVVEQWTIARGVCALGTPPMPGDFANLYLDFDAVDNELQVSSLEFTSAGSDALSVRLLAYQPATNAQTGRLVVEARRIGYGTGAPRQRYHLRGPALCEEGFELYTLEHGQLRRWQRRESLFASGAADLDFVLEAGTASVQFGDGQQGRVPPPDAIIIAAALETAGTSGNVAADAISSLDLGPHNAGLLRDPSQVAGHFKRISNPGPATGGADLETLEHAEGRAVQLLQQPSRAVTLADCEALALATPGTRIVRAAALANQHPGFQCYAAPGFLTVVIVPELPSGRPVPSTGLLSVVSAYLNRRHVIGTQIGVTGPEYLEIGVNAQVKVFAGQNKASVRDAVVAALQKFLDPLVGGPEGGGWPLGRDVYVSEVVEVIAAVAGVDHVLALELVVPGCAPQCGNVCLRPLALTVSGTHQIQVS